MNNIHQRKEYNKNEPRTTHGYYVYYGFEGINRTNKILSSIEGNHIYLMEHKLSHTYIYGLEYTNLNYSIMYDNSLSYISFWL